MKAVHILILLLLAAMASAAYILFGPDTPSEPAPLQSPAEIEVSVPEPIAPALPAEHTYPVVEPAVQPVQPIEERGDAMLFEIDALRDTPFDQAVTMPFD